MQTAPEPRDIEGIANWEEKLSAWMDGESTDELPDNLDTPAGRRTWDTYHLIGDVMRTPELSVEPSADFSAKLAAALADEPVIIARPRRHKLKIGLSGLAVAAAVASVVWVARPYLADPPAGEAVLAEAGTDAPVVATGLNDYLDAHRQMAGPNAVRQVSFDGEVQR